MLFVSKKHGYKKRRCEFKIEEMKMHSVSAGHGKGVTTYWKINYTFDKEINQSDYQMMRICSERTDIINVYRSCSNISRSTSFLNDLNQIFNRRKETYLVGDLNLCYIEDRKHDILRSIENLGFLQQVKHPTHIAGRQIDHVFYFSPDSAAVLPEVLQFGQYFSDHDLIQINIAKV